MNICILSLAADSISFKNHHWWHLSACYDYGKAGLLMSSCMDGYVAGTVLLDYSPF
jgi:hypothetical protein